MLTKTLIAAILTTLLLSSAASVAQTSDTSTSALGAVEIVIEAPKLARLQSVKDVIEKLKAAGFTYIEIKRTFLGRVQIIAYSATEIREIILNGTTNEVLRDIDVTQNDTETHIGKALGKARAPENKGNNQRNQGNSGNASGRAGN